jgi:hypothetical protein
MNPQIKQNCKNPMNPQIKQKWLSALRSGDYQQTQGHLHNEYGFCCLGVLCDLYRKENQLEWEPSTHYKNAYVFQDMVTVLPLSVMEWAGLEEVNPYPNGGRFTLGELNDQGSTFNEIAYVIEHQL